MVKLIASDMDGTLVNSDHIISQENASAIKYAQEKGVEFIITTGRAYEDSYRQVVEAGIQCNYLVMNGSELRNASGDVLQRLYMDKSLVEKIIQKLDDENLYVELYTTGGIFSTSSIELCKQAIATKINFFFPKISLEEAYEQAESHVQYKKIEKVSSLKDIWDKGYEVGKIINFSNDIEKLAHLREEIPTLMDVNTTGSFPINLEITDPRASKGEALKRYAETRNISLKDIMTIGDSYNDLTMLTNDFGYTVAMGNAISEVKDIAKFVTTTNNEDGVSKIIKKLIL